MLDSLCEVNSLQSSKSQNTKTRTNVKHLQILHPSLRISSHTVKKWNLKIKKIANQSSTSIS